MQFAGQVFKSNAGKKPTQPYVGNAFTDKTHLLWSSRPSLLSLFLGVETKHCGKTSAKTFPIALLRVYEMKRNLETASMSSNWGWALNKIMLCLLYLCLLWALRCRDSEKMFVTKLNFLNLKRDHKNRTTLTGNKHFHFVPRAEHEFIWETFWLPLLMGTW